MKVAYRGENFVFDRSVELIDNNNKEFVIDILDDKKNKIGTVKHFEHSMVEQRAYQFIMEYCETKL